MDIQCPNSSQKTIGSPQSTTKVPSHALTKGSPHTPTVSPPLKPKTPGLARSYTYSDGYQAKVRVSDSLPWGSEKRSHLSPWRQKLRDFLASAYLEAFTFCLIGVDISLTIVSMAISADDSSQSSIFAVSGFIIIVLMIDMGLRIFDEGPKKYFTSRLTVFESLIVLVSAAFLIMEAATGTNPVPGSSIGRAIRPAIRMTKVLRALFTTFFTRGGIQGRLDRAMDRMSDQLIDKYLGDVLAIHPDNMTFKPSTGYFCLQKAQVIADMFKDIHLPFTILGGAIELLLIDLPKKGEQEDEPGLIVAIHNVLLVIGPANVPPWDFEEVLHCQERLVDLLCRRLEAMLPKSDNKKSKKETDASSTNTKESANNFVKKAKQIGNNMIQNILRRGFQLDIQNFTIRYEDTGKLGLPAVGCFQIGSLHMGMSQSDDVEGQETEFPSMGRWRPKRSGQGQESSIGSDNSQEKACVHRHGSMLFSTFLQGLHVYWDVGYKAKPDQAPTMAGQIVSMREFLEGVRIAQNWEKTRHAVCRAICHGKARSKGTRARRLRENCVQHTYLLYPVNLTVHAIFSPHQAKLFGTNNTNRAYNKQNSKSAGVFGLKGSNTKDELRDVVVDDPKDWNPMLDVHVDIPPIEVGMDPMQLESMKKVLKYEDKWNRANNRFMWQPLGEDGRIPPKFRWHFALRCIQRRICPHYGWKMTALHKLRRISAFRTEYIFVLLDRKRAQERLNQSSRSKRTNNKHDIVKLPHERRIRELQVFLPLSEILLAHATVSQTEVALDDSCELPLQSSPCSDSQAELPSDCSDGMGEVDSTERRIVNHSKGEADGTEKNDLEGYPVADSTNGNVETETPEDESHRKAIQFRVHLEVVRIILFNAPSEETPGRRRLMRGELDKLSVTICRAAPLVVQSWRGPVGFVPKLGCIMMEASIDDARAVNMSAPSSMSHVSTVRHLLRRKPTANDTNQQLRDPLLHIDVGKYPAESPDDLSKMLTTVKLGDVEVNVCRPLLTNLQVHFGGRFEMHPGVDGLEDKIAISRKYFNLHKHRLWKMQKGFESMSGLQSRSSLNVELTISGLTCKALEPFTGSLWCCQHVVLAPCVLKIERGGDPAKFQCAFHLCEDPLVGHSQKASMDEEESSAQVPQELQHDAKTKDSHLPTSHLPTSPDSWVQDVCLSPVKCCGRMCDARSIGTEDSGASGRPIDVNTRAEGAVNSFSRWRLENPSVLSVRSPESWSFPTQVSVEVLTSEALGLPDPASVPEMNFPGMGLV